MVRSKTNETAHESVARDSETIVYEIGPFRLDPAAGVLTRFGVAGALGPRDRGPRDARAASPRGRSALAGKIECAAKVAGYADAVHASKDAPEACRLALED